MDSVMASLFLARVRGTFHSYWSAKVSTPTRASGVSMATLESTAATARSSLRLRAMESLVSMT